METYYVYILTNERNTVLHIGVTNDLIRRIWEHKEKKVPGFLKRYNLTKLVYDEVTNGIVSAIERERQLKRWHKDWKWNWIKEHNPGLKDLYPGLTGS